MRIVSLRSNTTHIKFATLEIGSTFKYGGFPYIKMGYIVCADDEKSVVNALDPAKGIPVFFEQETMVTDINTYTLVENYEE